MAWNLVDATFVPGMALEDPAQGEQGTVDCAMFFERFQRVGRATRIKAATASASRGERGQRVQHRGKQPPVEVDGNAE